jgi:2'-5' RNA ligase
LRLFTALWPTPALRAALCARRDAIAWPRGAAIVADARLHLTLHFIGAVPSDRLPQLVPALQVPCCRIDIELGAAQSWPHGLVVLPVMTTPEPLRELHATLAAALSGLGLPPERRAFRPHVTLARRAAGAGLPPSTTPLRWRAAGYSLVCSHPLDGYQVLARYGARGVNAATTSRIATRRSLPPPAPKPR